MQNNSAADVLRALAQGDATRSETARLRDVFGEVEGALAAGVSRAAILEALHGQGFTMTPKAFESALYRIRKARAKQGQAKSAPASPAAPAAPSRPTTPTPAHAPTAQEEARPDPTQADSEAPAPEQPPERGPDGLTLTPKQRREWVADQFVKPGTNPRLAKLLNKDKK